MSKRESSVDSSRGLPSSVRNSRITNVRAQAMNLVHRKPGAMNVRPTSSYKILQSRMDAKRNGSNVQNARNFDVTSTRAFDIPKTRIGSARCWNTDPPRLGYFPAESVKKSVAGWSYSQPFVCKSVDQNTHQESESQRKGVNQLTSRAALPNHGYGDSSDIPLAVGQVQEQPKTQQNQQDPTTNVGLRSVPGGQSFDGKNQSESILNKHPLSPGRRIHRPFVPDPTHGMTVRDLTEYPSIRNNSMSSTQLQWQQITSAGMQQAGQSQNLTEQQLSRNTQQSAINPISEENKIVIQNIKPWSTQDSLMPNYESLPIGNRASVGQDNTFCFQEKQERQMRDVTITESKNQNGVSCDDSDMRQAETHVESLQKPHLNQRELRQEQLFSSQPVKPSRKPPQDVRQIHQQLQNNMIHQREMQQRAQNHHQHAMVQTQRQNVHWSLPSPLKDSTGHTLAHQESCSDRYKQQQPVIDERFLKSLRDVQTASSQGDPKYDMNIHHHQRLIQKGNTSYETPQLYPHQSRVHNIPPAAIRERENEENYCPPVNTKRYEQSQSNYAHFNTSQRITYHTNLHRRPEIPTIHEYPYIQRQERGSLSSLPQQQRQTTSIPSPVQACEVDDRKYNEPRLQQNENIAKNQTNTLQKFDQLDISQPSQTSKKKYSEFTPAMVRDQELLVANMRQQKIPENIMKRQFDALLSEQRRYLAFLSSQESVTSQNETLAPKNLPALSECDRSDFMRKMLPGRINFEKEQELKCSTNEPTVTEDREQQKSDSERIGSNGGRQVYLFPRLSNHPRYSNLQPYHYLNQNAKNMNQLRQQQMSNWHLCDTIPPTRSMYNRMPTRQVYSTNQATLGSAQPTNYLQSEAPRDLSRRKDYLHMAFRHDPQQQERQDHQHEDKLPQVSALLYEQQPPQSQHPRLQNHLRQQSPNFKRSSAVTDAIPQQSSQHVGCKSKSLQEQRPKNELSSLLKQREYQIYVRPQKQNNGLQDVHTVIENLESLKSLKAEKGLEYVINPGNKIKPLQLNGTQDPSEISKIPQPPIEYLQRIQQPQRSNVSSNGLCNTRNANNPAPPPTTFEKPTDNTLLVGYPRQYCATEGQRAKIKEGSCIMVAEKENGSVADALSQELHHGTAFLKCGRYPQIQIPTSSRTPFLSKSPIMPYGFTDLVPRYRQKVEQFVGKKQSFKNTSKPDDQELFNLECTALNDSTTTDVRSRALRTDVDFVKSDVQGTQQETVLDNYRQKEPILIETQYTAPSQPIFMPCTEKYVPQLPENKQSIEYYHMAQRDTTNIDHGQPELQEPKTIGGFTYLARRINYIQHSPLLIAPNTLIASKFLQPVINFS